MDIQKGALILMPTRKRSKFLDFAFQRLALQPGPRFFAGDWNFAIDSLRSTGLLGSAGWVEVQDHFSALTGAPVQVACKQATRKDFLWLSPELALGFQSLEVDHQTFADHSVFLARFVGSEASLVFGLVLNKFLGLKRSLFLHLWTFCPPHNPTVQHAKLWTSKENSARTLLGDKWDSSMHGRGQQLKPKRIVGQPAPIKQGRSHDVQPEFLAIQPCMPNSSSSCAHFDSTAC